jgi:hypothetical protein
MTEAQRKWLWRVLLVFGLVGAVLWGATLYTFVSFHQSVDRVQFAMTDFCAAGDGSYDVGVRLENDSDHPLTIEAYVITVNYQGSRVAKERFETAQTIGARQEHTQTLTLSTKLRADERPELDGCDPGTRWEAIGQLEFSLPFARRLARKRARLGD